MKNTKWMILIAGLTSVPVGTATAQLADPAFDPVVASPTYEAGSGPTVAIDAAHLNFHTAEGAYAPFAKLLRRDGYQVKSNREPFAKASLDGVDVLVISNAMHEQSEAHWAPLPNHSAFTEAEIAAVEAWVRSGGSLLLIADHMPLPGHAEGLAGVFGVRFQNGFVLGGDRKGRITFDRSEGSLADHAVVNGRSPAERVDYHGQGRVAVFGEAAMFTAQLAGPNRIPIGMNAPSARHNDRFVLNVLRWLSGAR